MSVKITYFVHGTTIDNENNIATGWADGKLSELGQQQSRDLGKLLTNKNFDAVFSSDLGRAVESARLTFGDRYVPVQDKRLREINYGDYTRKPESFKENLTAFVDSKFPNGESYHDVENRVKDLCDYLKSNYNGKHIAIVAHQAPQLALEVVANGKTWEQAIANDWRRTKSWQPGWDYEIS